MAASSSENPSNMAEETACTNSSIRNSILAGYAAGATGTLVGHPLDSLKVWMQTGKSCLKPTSSTTQPSAAKIANPIRATALAAPPGGTMPTVKFSTIAYAGADLSAISRMAMLRQVKALYSGVTGPLFTVGMVQSINFAVYDASRRILYAASNREDGKPFGDYRNDDSLQNVCLSSLIAGATISGITGPLIVIKTIQQTSGVGFREALLQTVSPRGHFSLSGMYVGFGPHFLCETLGRAVYFVSYEQLKRRLVVSMQDGRDAATYPPHQNGLSLPQRMGCAALSGMLSWSVIYPLDALRCRLVTLKTTSAHPATTSSTLPDHHNTRSAWQLAVRQLREPEGIQALYRGLGVTVLRAGSVAAVVLPVYDMAFDYLSS